MNRNKKILMKTMSITLCTAMLAGNCASVLAADTAQKDENVYVNLNQDGSVSNIYVVNEFTLSEDGSITDYGDYKSVKNLSSTEELKLDGQTVTGNASKGKFYYQGDLNSTEMPWKIGITWKLDGKEMQAEELAGKSGKLELTIDIKENPDCKEEFFDNYLLQATVVLDTDKCTNIIADGATAANVGSNRQLLYNIMAGNEKTLTITADVEDFEMEGLTFQGVPMSFDIDKDSLDLTELTDKTDEIKDGVEELNNGAGDLDDGVGEAKDGAEELKDGTASALSGAKELQEGAVSAVSGAGTLKDCLSSASSGMSSLTAGTSSALSGAQSLKMGADTLGSGISTTAEGVTTLSEGASSLASGTKELKSGVSTYVSGVNSLGTGVKKYTDGVKKAAEGTAQLKDLEKLGEVHTAVDTLYQAVNGDGGENPGLSGAAGSLTTGLGELKKQVQALSASQDTEELEKLSAALQEAGKNAETLAVGASQSAEQLSSCASAVEAITGYHTAVMTGLNTQASQVKQEMLNEVNARIDEVNQEIADYESSLNGKIDAGLAVVDEFNADGKYEAQAAIARGMAAAARPDGFQVEHLTEEDITSSVTMPAEEAEILNILGQLQAGSKAMKEASTSFQTAAESLSTLAGQLPTASTEDTGDTSTMTALLNAITEAYNGAAAIESGISQTAGALSQLDEKTKNFSQAGEGIKNLNTAMTQLKKNSSTLEKAVTELKTGGKNLKTATSSVDSGAAAVDQGVTSVSGAMTSLKNGSTSLSSGASSLVSGLYTLDSGANTASSGLSQLSTGAETLESGLGDLSDGIDTLYDGLGDLDDGAADLVSGLGDLKDGSEEMKDGTEEFQDKTSDIDDQIEDKIDELIDSLSGKDYETVSFTSSKNTDIGLVQFAIHTEAIKKADVTEEETEAETETESETLLSRVKSLFS